ncbi:uncharacterized protein LOC102079518 isoform X2 [Oreochromis niloticus]|uniref:uncharacterized protein LOC102079518 isoform X2 n=1 Tax=Oreochromis niloticus TaxID=8128 RepID=UPI000674C54C|nr:uncharacterized protein LOC102079518 isoform X2 [Oreochromis niloticus]CAI5652063.1 unnamed protein product [Mustela putorius furo]
MWAVTFTPQGEMEPRTLMNGSLIIKDNWFFDRIWTVMDGIEMNAVETIDSGTLEFRDPEGDLALSAQLNANRAFISESTLLPVIGLVAIIVIICICWCCKMNCKSSPQTQTEGSPEPNVYCHDQDQPTGQRYSGEPPPPYWSCQPMNFHVPEQPTGTSSEPPAYHEVALPGRWNSTPHPPVSSDPLLSTLEPHFDLEGVTVPSAPSLSSEF